MRCFLHVATIVMGLIGRDGQKQTHKNGKDAFFYAPRTHRKDQTPLRYRQTDRQIYDTSITYYIYIYEYYSNLCRLPVAVTTVLCRLNGQSKNGKRAKGLSISNKYYLNKTKMQTEMYDTETDAGNIKQTQHIHIEYAQALRCATR